MKKFLLFVLSLAFAAGTQVQADEIILSYCEGIIANSSNGGTITHKSGVGDVHCTVCFPKETIGTYKNNKITKIRVGYPTNSSTPSTTTAWIRTDREDKNTAIVSQEAATVSGWNIVELAEPLVITDTTDLWVGFTFHQTKAIDVVSFAGPTSEYACWWAKGSMWTDFASKNYGSLPIEIVVEGDNMPQWNMQLKDVESERPLYKVGTNMVVKGAVKNMAAQTISSYTVSYEVSGVGNVSGSKTFNGNLEYRDEANFSITIPTTGLAEGSAEVKLTLTIDGQEDENTADNEATVLVGLVENGYPRIAYLEEFTTEKCPNCPSAITRINSALDNNGLRNSVVWIEHHNGYYTDQYTATESNSYLWFYTGSGTYAPAIMVDRTYTSPYCDAASPVGFPNQPSEIAAWIKKSTDELALVGVEITNIEINGLVATVSVKCEKSSAFDAVCQAPRINVVVVEDDLKSTQQSGYSGTCTHEGVFRACNGTWGQTFTWNGNKYEGSFDINLKSTWVTNNMKAVAFVSTYDSTNRLNCQIHNTNSAKFTDEFSTGINIVDTEDAQVMNVEYYTISGKLASENDYGVLLKVSTLENGKKVAEKILRK